ncbi:EGF domain-specific O-linked N-acetylglucosamine transferase-like protein [Dinothrombium tinctorium]|uniref:EGF domain-specific O-linked N-acetylglucosamine transferase n=1 Tax=Dinothrombium tinctorium TaxID=1965070 RepID=A0A3S3SNL7_9ACAR|nr:EGF domain-specific O-linked N-acetylglucosamine transferase-like protein [Dinothrombium tinctorium]
MKLNEPMRYKDDILDSGAFCGFDCELKQAALLSQSAHKSALQSWFNEIQHFTLCPKNYKCDIEISKPTFIVKLDATVNMYHHFCDFINLYLTLHLNNSFSMDNNILIWDIFPYKSNFGLTWKAFTQNPILDLSKFKGKHVCFKDVVFPLLPRMIFGMYYNMPLIPGCQKSGVFHAFNRHILYKLKIKQEYNLENHTDPENRKLIRITFLSRSTQYRRVLNEDELIAILRRKSRHFKVTKVDFNHRMPFEEQLKITQNSDILIGMHGAGLTHVLFQPDWGVLFELYNCEDPNCYKDLTRLRGLKYITWENNDKVYPEDKGHHPELGAHLKFTNYRFEETEFLNLVMKGVKHVKVKRNEFFDKLIEKNKKDKKQTIIKDEL